MGIRKKILFFFSFTTILLTSLVLIFIYTLFSQYRKEEFQQRQKEKIKSTLFFLSETQKADKELTELIGRFKLNELHDEKLLIFNENKELIYSSIDDVPVQYSSTILEGLSDKDVWYEGSDGKYDVVGLYFHKNQHAYYGISKAYDTFGISKLNYLGIILFSSFLVISIAVIFIAYFLATKITRPLLSLSNQFKNYKLEDAYVPIEMENSKDEIATLAEQFNKLMKRMNEAFSFQKHAIHHISHELKTPISILVSNFEKIEKEQDMNKLRDMLHHQKVDTRNLSEIIHSLLEISKVETGKPLKKELIRLDELLFDCANELKMLYPDFQFSIHFTPVLEEKFLELEANESLIKSAFLNLMVNCIHYGSENKATIWIDHTKYNALVAFKNKGTNISPEEQHFLFQHFFRGKNSKNKRGFGLGLVYVQKIVQLHGGKVNYQVEGKENVFTLTIPFK